MVRTRLLAGAFVLLLAQATAVAPALAADSQEATPAVSGSEPSTVPAAPAGSPAPAMDPTPSPRSSPSGNDVPAPSSDVPMVAASAQTPGAARYGVGARFRVTSVPKWLLGLFLDESVPLTSYTGGLEFFRRSGNFELAFGVAYQNLSPKDGNWLGAGNDPSQDTDLIQFRNLSSISVDAAFILHTEFNEYVGIHYGGGVGVGIVRGKMLRTSAGSPGCATDPGNRDACYPVCAGGRCTEQQLQNSQGGMDSPLSPSRFSDNHVPTIYPIVNLITGLDVRLPTVPGLAFKVDLGYFFPYFFAGAGLAYQL